MKTTQATHTPTPWTLNKKALHPWVIEAPSNIPGIPAEVVKVGYRPNAAFIVRAVNSYEEMLEALKSVKQYADIPGDVISIVKDAIAKAEAL